MLSLKTRTTSEQSCVLLKLTHHQQRFTWDCGIACIQMVLALDKSADLLKNFDKILEALQLSKSVWTIDLCYLLNKFDIKHKFYTVTIGVNMDFKGSSYYNRILNNDEQRVSRRFKEANSYGLEIFQQNVTHDELVRHIKDNGPCIVLVDSNILVCDLCGHNKFLTELDCLRCCSRPYLGHYIVLCGFNLARDRFLYRNPAFKDRVCATCFENLHRARTAFGTDEDIILVYNS